jgi:hypothetical protein
VAKTAAWNGNKIDLSKIPPRREARAKGGNSGSGGSERYVRLKKGPDGYWYEI